MMKYILLALLLAPALGMVGYHALTPAPLPATTGSLRLHLKGQFATAKTLELANCPEGSWWNRQQPEPSTQTEVLTFDISRDRVIQLPDRMYCFPKITLQNGNSRMWKNQTITIHQANSVSLYVSDESISGEMTPTPQEQFRRTISGLWTWIFKAF